MVAYTWGEQGQQTSKVGGEKLSMTEPLKNLIMVLCESHTSILFGLVFNFTRPELYTKNYEKQRVGEILFHRRIYQLVIQYQVVRPALKAQKPGTESAGYEQTYTHVCTCMNAFNNN